MEKIDFFKSAIPNLHLIGLYYENVEKGYKIYY